MLDEVWLSLFAVALAAGQLLFKRAADDIRGAMGIKLLASMLTSPALWMAGVVYAAATILWVWLLTRVPLSRAYPFSALAMVLVPLAANLLFGERIRPAFWVGAALIVCGIVLMQRQVADTIEP